MVAHFAQLNKSNIVIDVIVIHNNSCRNEAGDEDEAVGVAFCQSLYGIDTNWRQTSYNGKFRGCYAGIGYQYDQQKDVFLPPIQHVDRHPIKGK